MKKVCFVINNLFGGGAERSVIKLAQEFDSQGYESHIIIIGKVIDYDVGKIPVHSLSDVDKIPANIFEKIMESELLGGVVTRMIRRLTEHYRFSYSLLHRRQIMQLRDKMNELGYFVATFSYLQTSIFLCIAAGIPNLYCCIRSDIESRIGSWASNFIFPNIRKRLLLSQQRNFYKGQNLITVADELKQTTLAMGIKPASIQSIYNTFYFDKIRKLSEEYDVEENDYIIYLGRFVPEKGLDMLIDAYKLSGISQKLLLMGHGENKEDMRKKVRIDNLQDEVIFKDFINNPYPYMKNAKVVVLASNNEGLSGILIEALILGTPVVSTSCPTGPKEILTGELAEFLSPPGDTQALADNIRKVIDSPPTIKDEHIAKFHKDANFGKYLKLIEDATKQDA